MDRAQGTPDAPVIRRTKSGWGVSAGYPYYLTETKTRHAAQEWIDKAAATRADLAAFDAAKAERLAAWLDREGLEVIDHRDLRARDLFASTAHGPVREVTSVSHFDNGVSQAFFGITTAARVNHEPNCNLLSGAFPVYGALRHEHGEGKAA
jgi:hypothetical protein